MSNKRLLLFILLITSGTYVFGQSPLYFTGYGRALISKSQYDPKSNFINNDSTSKKRVLDGNFVFDLGVNVKPNEQFKALAILRVSNQFGGFYSNGSLLEFRQVQIQGILAKKVNYSIGDIDLMQTKYTLYNNNEPTYSEFEADAFKIRRDIVGYENFNNGNNWRLQGLQAGTKLNFTKIIKSIQVNGFATRTIASDYLLTPDRILYGGNLKVKQSKYIELGANLVGLTDIMGTVQDTIVFYKNSVVSGEYKLSASTRTLNFSTFGEIGRSFYDLNLVDAKKQVKLIDGFFDVGANATHRYIPFSLNLGYRLVGPDFSSPGAQTRRVFDDQSGVLLAEGMNRSALRNASIFDRMSDLNLYNRSLSTTLMYFNPAYNNSTPYGAATPNRKGLTVDLKYGNKDSLLYVNLNAQVLSEVLGTGIKDKRNFLVLNPGATLNVNRLFGLNRLMAISGAYRYEKTTGSDAANINLTSTLIDGSVAIETLKNLDLIGGIKLLSSKGNEILFERDVFNQIYDYTLYSSDFSNKVYSVGTRYRLTNYIFVAFNAFVQENKYDSASALNYKINQYYFSYIMRF